jgi:DNA-binding transcriptional ArsR family regulator
VIGVTKLDPPELFAELVRRSLAFRIIVLLTKHRELLTSELVIMLDHRYSKEAIKRALTYLLRNGLVRKIRRGHSRIVMLNEDGFITKLTKFINTLHEKDLWGVFEKTFLGTKSRIKVVMALMNGPMVKTELAKASKVQGGTPTDLMLKPLLSHGLVIEYRGRRRVEYELNKNHPLNQVLMGFLREIGVDGNCNNNRNNGNKDMYYMLAREVVDYVIEHWDDYVINIHRRDTIKLTGVMIRSIAMKIAEKKGWKIAYIGWLVDFIIEEFKKRGFCVMVKKNGQRPNIVKVKVYVSRVGDGNGD